MKSKVINPKKRTNLRGYVVVLVLSILIPYLAYATEGDTWIVFDCNRENPDSDESTFWDIWKLDPDGNGSQESDSLFGLPLTIDPGNEWHPTYSSEAFARGEFGAVVFVSDKDGWPHLYKISVNDGPYPSYAWGQLTHGNYADVDPCFSFDGEMIAFTSNRNGNWHIYTMNPQGGEEIQITHEGNNRSPCFSSDGNKIFFISDQDKDEIGDWEIYVADLTQTPIEVEKVILDDQDPPQPLLVDYTEHDPCCSPTDPNVIVFATNVATPTYTDPGLIGEADRINFELFSYSFVTKDTNRLTESWNEYCCDSKGKPISQLWNSSMPCFSPDGECIAWTADNWTGQVWQGNLPENRPYANSFWKPDFGQGACHHIWTCELAHFDDHYYYFPPSYWGYEDEHGWDPPPSRYTHMHHKHYNPSWDYQP